MQDVPSGDTFQSGMHWETSHLPARQATSATPGRAEQSVPVRAPAVRGRVHPPPRRKNNSSKRLNHHPRELGLTAFEIREGIHTFISILVLRPSKNTARGVTVVAGSEGSLGGRIARAHSIGIHAYSIAYLIGSGASAGSWVRGWIGSETAPTSERARISIM